MNVVTPPSSEVRARNHQFHQYCNNCRNPSELRGPCKDDRKVEKAILDRRNPSELRGPCKLGPHSRDQVH